jgi:hypothetical protein
VQKVHLTPFQSPGRAARRIGSSRLHSPDMANMLDVIVCTRAVATSQTAGDASNQTYEL